MANRRAMIQQQNAKHLPDAFVSSNRALLHSDGSISFGPFRLTRTGLVIETEYTDTDLDDVGYFFAATSESVQFSMGDWANLFVHEDMTDDERGIVYSQLAKQFSIERKTLNNYASVARSLPPSLRREALFFSHHAEIAWLPEPLKGHEQDFLDAAVERRWSVRQLRDHIRLELDDVPEDTPITIVKTPYDGKIPNLKSKVLQKHYFKARDGDKESRAYVDAKIAEYRRWLQEYEDSLDK